jgi:hypothetical protein
MSRIPMHDIDTAPEGARETLAGILAGPSAGLGRLLNLQGQMAHAPAVLAGYMGLRRAIETNGTFDPAVRFAIMLTVASVDRCEYGEALNTMLARSAGWADADIELLQAGENIADAGLDALLRVVREAAAGSGRVSAGSWNEALANGWTDAELAEAYAYLGLTRFVDDFVAYALTEFDVPATRDAATSTRTAS